MNKKVIIGGVVVLVVIAVIAAVAVGGKDDTSTKASTTPNTSNTDNMANMDNNSNPSSNSQASATDKVSISNFAFSPQQITVKVGTKVTWTNNDSTSHTVTADSGTGPDSGTLATGASYSFTYSTAGTFAYHCEFHSDMHGSVVVTQ